MELKQLRYFLTITEEGQITAAAKRLHIAQPPLSYQLRLLEKELGVTLLERGPRNIRLTGAGELLQRRAAQILEMAASTKSELMDYGRNMSGVLSIGTISSSGGIVPNPRMLEFTRSYPDIRFEIREGNTFSVMEMLEKGIIDIGVVRTPFHRPAGVCSRIAPREPMLAVMTDPDACAPGKGFASLAELAGKPLIIYRRFETLLVDTFAQAGLEPFFCCKNDDARTTLLWARAGLGIGIVPESALLTAETTGLTHKVIRCEELRTSLAVIWMKNRYLSSLGRKFIEFFAQEQNAEKDD